MDNFKEWDVELRKNEAALVPGEILKLQRKLVLLTLGAAVQLAPGKFKKLSGVVLLTPVDTGRARSSWNVSVGQPDTSVPPISSGRRAGTNGGIRDAQASMRTLGPFQTVWVTSSLPYMEVLEFGGYPNPVKRGSWDKRLRQYVVKSSGGFSKQAPRGMVRITVQGVLDALQGVTR
jgi:hypothetical protein